MAKCKRCGKGNIFTKIDDFGLCPQCEKYLLTFVKRNFDVYFESNKMMIESVNLSTKISRANVALENLYTIKEFCNEHYDIYKILIKSDSIDEVIENQKEAINELSNIYFGFEDIILTFLNDEGIKTKRQIIDLINSSLEKEDANLPYDIDKTVASILDDLEYKQKVSKEKIKNRYHYSIKLETALKGGN